jgi:nitronate monooxygenase
MKKNLVLSPLIIKGKQSLPVIQGGMGVRISTWQLARAVALVGGIGILSGTAIHIIIARLLQLGDPGGNIKRAFDAFPFQETAKRVYEKYFISQGKREEEKFRDPEMFSLYPSRELIELTVIANFAEVFLAKEGHTGLIGINFMEKIQLPHIYSFFGAMLAGVDIVTAGAGIPLQFPSILEGLAKGEAVKYWVDVTGAVPREFSLQFNPGDFFSPYPIPKMSQPAFFPIISSTVLAKRMAKELPGKIDAIVIENSTAGGHNAPPRNKSVFNERGEPVYGHKDEVDLLAIKALGIPYVRAGGYSNPERARQALRDGAAAIQAGTIFQYSEDSGLDPNIRSIARAMAFQGKMDIFTSRISPTGYPFKIALIPETLSDPPVYANRPRICDLGFLRELYKKEDGSVGYRCSAEPIGAYTKKGGEGENCHEKACLCTCLMANAGLSQRRAGGYIEPPLVTSGDDISFVQSLMSGPYDSYSAEDAVNYILGETK